MNSLNRSVSELPDVMSRNRTLLSKPPVWLFSHPSMAELAQNVSRSCEGSSSNSTSLENVIIFLI